LIVTSSRTAGSSTSSQSSEDVTFAIHHRLPAVLAAEIADRRRVLQMSCTARGTTRHERAANESSALTAGTPSSVSHDRVPTATIRAASHLPPKTGMGAHEHGPEPRSEGAWCGPIRITGVPATLPRRAPVVAATCR
jgi:hypothetical protein